MLISTCFMKLFGEGGTLPWRKTEYYLRELLAHSLRQGQLAERLQSEELGILDPRFCLEESNLYSLL